VKGRTKHSTAFGYQQCSVVGLVAMAPGGPEIPILLMAREPNRWLEVRSDVSHFLAGG